MKLVLQRVKKASVRVKGQETARIGKGVLILIGVQKGDSPEQAAKLAQKVSQLRIFEDDEGKMNLPVGTTGGELLVVSQFTLAADLGKGNRPSFDPAEAPEKAQRLIGLFVEGLKKTGLKVQEGSFGTRMEVDLTNEGPVTFLLE